MIDLGAGAFANLLRYVSVDTVPILVISHLHYDHYSDVYSLYVARRFWSVPLEPLTVFLPPGSEDFLSGYFTLSGERGFKGMVEFEEFADGSILRVGELMEVETYRVDHTRESYALRVSCGEAVVTYSSDTGYCQGLVEAAQGSDLFICEATFTNVDMPPHGNHLSGKEAGLVAGEAGVKRLMITHVWPTFDPELVRMEAQEAWGREVILAEEGLTIEI